MVVHGSDNGGCGDGVRAGLDKKDHAVSLWPLITRACSTLAAIRGGDSSSARLPLPVRRLTAERATARDRGHAYP